MFTGTKLGLIFAKINLYRISLDFWTWDRPREVVSARSRRSRAETTRGPIPGPTSKIECDFVHITCLKKVDYKNTNLKCMYFPKFKTYLILFICMHTCISYRTLLTIFCHLIVINGNFKQVFINFLDL